MRFDVYGRFELEVVREGRGWVAYRRGAGTRVRDDAIAIPLDLQPAELAAFLDDHFHELARPGQVVRRIA